VRFGSWLMTIAVIWDRRPSVVCIFISAIAIYADGSNCIVFIIFYYCISTTATLYWSVCTRVLLISSFPK
jgi:hypothetical protein